MRRFSYFAFFDFDGTAGDTFKPNRNGIGVNEAYKMACDKIFGTDFAHFERAGGLQNRGPVEFVSAILENGERDKLIERAHVYLQKHKGELDGYVPAGKGASLVWDGDPLSVISELLVRVKLKLLTAQIGGASRDDNWPKPCPGFVEFWRGILAFNEVSPIVKFVPGIVSSGHDLFIRECFKMWGLPEPALMVTDDTMRSPVCAHLPLAERIKPRVGPVRILCEQWLKEQKRNIGHEDPLSCIAGRGFYAGDSLATDGDLAKNLDLCFLWFNPEGKETGSFAGQVVKVSDWREIIGLLTSRKAVSMMTVGVPFRHIAQTLFY